MNINKGHIFLFIVILFLLVPGKGFTQTIATGHISAEVIESISTSSLIVATLVLTIPSENNTNLQGPQTSVTPMSNSGVITLTSVNTFTLNVVLKSDPISVGQNDDLKIEPSPIITGLVSKSTPENSQSIPINGTSNFGETIVPGQYHGTYTVILACN